MLTVGQWLELRLGQLGMLLTLLLLRRHHL
jgi:hypothetical protein